MTKKSDAWNEAHEGRGSGGAGPLFDAPAPVEEKARKAAMVEAFEKFHAENPNVLLLVIREARALKAAGHAHGAIGMVWERLRWIYAVETRTADTFRLNDHHKPFYARLAMHRTLDLAEFFETREQTIDFDPAKVKP